MSLIYTLNTPITVGDINSNITVSSLKLVSISVNFEDVYTNSGVAVLSICLCDPVSGYPMNVVYQDASALSMAQTIEAQTGAELFQKLIADNKLPTGTLSDASTTTSTDTGSGNTTVNGEASTSTETQPA